MEDALTRRANLRAHAELAELESAVRAGEWSIVRAAVGDCQPGSDRSFLFRFVTDDAGARALVEPHAEADPLAAAMLAQVEVIEAWEIRSGARAEHVSEDQFTRFRAKLIEAEQRLTRLIALHPEQSDAWVVRLVTARGLQLGHSEAKRRWRRAAELSPGDLWAHQLMLQYWAPKWFGSEELMNGFVAESIATAPEGSPLHTLVISAELEQWLELGGGDPGRDHLRQPEVIERVLRALRQSLAHPSYERSYGWVELENAAAMLMSMAEAWNYARHHYDQVGDLVTEHPWGYLNGSPAESFTVRRDEARKRTS